MGGAAKSGILMEDNAYPDTLALTDAGVDMGGLGADAAVETADIIIMDDDLSKLGIGVQKAKRTTTIVRQNTVFVLVIKAAALALSALGLAGMWAAVAADVGACLLAVLNAMRALKR